MATIQNQAIIQKLIDELELYPALEKMPTELAEKILPVFQVNSEKITVSPKTSSIIRTAYRESAGSTILYTTSSTNDFYLSNAVFSFACQIAGASNEARLTIVSGGTSYNLFEQKITFGGSGHNTVSLNLSQPLKLDKNSAITLTNDVSDIDSSAAIIGYEED